MRTTDQIAQPGSGEGIPAAVTDHPTSSKSLLRWRREQLVAAGLDELSAQRIVRTGNVDIHALVMSAERRRRWAEGGHHGW